MDDILRGLKDVADTLTALGWLPIPAFVAIVLMLAARSYFEQSIIKISSLEEMKKHGWIKMAIFWSVFGGSLLLQVGLAKPKLAYDWCLSLGFSFANTGLGYLVSSSERVKNLLRVVMGKETGVQNETPKS